MKSKKVLIVENNDLTRKLLENLIAPLYSFESVKNGVDAVAKAKEEKFDLILMNIQMPNMDGITASKTIWRQAAHQCPIIAITPYSAEATRKCFLEMGFDDWITKPIRPKEFLEVISAVINSNGATFPPEEITEKTAVLNKKIPQQLLKFQSVEIIKSIYADFLEEFDQLICQIDAAFTEKNKQVIIECLHTIKGNSGSLGADTIFELSHSADLTARTLDWDSLGIVLKKLKNERIIFEEYLHEETTFTL